MSAKKKDNEPLRFPSRARWADWLDKNHDSSGGIWLAVARKHAMGLHYEDSVEEALAYGWIDSTARKLDDDAFQIWFAPRKPGSDWSSSNKERVARLTAEGKMKPAGQAVVDRAREDGSWKALDSVERLEVPDDLRRAFEYSRKARDAYEKLAPSHRKQYLYWINSAKRPETRERRVRETVRRLEAGD